MTEKGVYGMECRHQAWILFFCFFLISGCGSMRTDEIPDGTESAEPVSSAADLQGKIRDQCFQVELEGQGEVTFVSCAPDQSAKETEDAVFWLERDGEIQYQFPYVMEGNCRPQQSFVQVREVCFQDYDEDEKKDVMIVVEYRPLTGTEDQENITEVRLYRNRPDRREFALDTDRMDMLNRNQWNHSVDEVMEHMGEAEQRLLLEYLTDLTEEAGGQYDF